MRYIKSYQQLNESTSIGSDLLNSLLDKFSTKVDTKKLAELILPNKNILLPYYKKYVRDGVINADMIYSDFSKFNFSANESDDYADDKNNHPVLRFLYKLFVRWPKNFISGLWNLFGETVIASWKEGDKVMAFFMIAMWTSVAIVVFALGYATYAFIEHSINGLESGVVDGEEFRPGHYEVHVHTIRSGKSTTTYTTNDWVPDTWYIKVVGENGRIEMWSTNNSKIGLGTEPGDKVINDDDWTWCETD
jgi:hypothetical protein